MAKRKRHSTLNDYYSDNLLPKSPDEDPYIKMLEGQRKVKESKDYVDQVYKSGTSGSTVKKTSSANASSNTKSSTNSQSQNNNQSMPADNSKKNDNKNQNPNTTTNLLLSGGVGIATYYYTKNILATAIVSIASYFMANKFITYQGQKTK